jgi:hypothetical protein
MFKYFITILACAALPSTVESNNDSHGPCKAPLNGLSLVGECQPTAVCASAGRVSVPDHCPGEADIQCCVDPKETENPNPDPQETENPATATQSPVATSEEEPDTSNDLPEIASPTATATAKKPLFHPFSSGFKNFVGCHISMAPQNCVFSKQALEEAETHALLLIGKGVFPPNSILNGQAGAFRHCLWNAIMAKKIGVRDTNNFSISHTNFL